MYLSAIKHKFFGLGFVAEKQKGFRVEFAKCGLSSNKKYNLVLI